MARFSDVSAGAATAAAAEELEKKKADSIVVRGVVVSLRRSRVRVWVGDGEVRV